MGAGKAAASELAIQNAVQRMANTLFVGKVYHHFDELPSTNDYARELLAKSKPPEGTVVRAASQSAGRGQFGSRWLAEPGANLTLSVIFYPTGLSVASQFRLSEAMALAVRDTVAQCLGDADVRVKWPNDIYIGPHKTAGILIQNTLQGQFLHASVVGIGLNVNQADFPAELPNATSLARATGDSFDLEAVAESLLECLERRYLQLRAGQFAALREEYHAHLLGRGEMRRFVGPGGEFGGVIRGVREDGQLAVLVEGEEMFFAVKAVQML